MGVKWSQVQILSARQRKTSLSCGHPVTRGSDYAELPTNLGPRRSLQVLGPHLSDGQMLAGSTPVGPTLYA